MLPHLASHVRSVGLECLITRRAEICCRAVIQCQGYSLTSDPITSVVAVAVDEGDFDTTIQQGIKVLEPTRARVIANGAKSRGHGT